ncbi:MAG TPA: hypothetical protein VF263_19355 [Longimicrobiaceae bacterium]
MSRSTLPVRGALLLALALAAPGCLAAAAAAGAGGAIAYTQRGAGSVVQGTVDQTFQRGVAVFRDMGITRTGESTEDGGAERKLTGTRGETEVTVEIERETASTSKVEVYARRSPVEWDRELAKDVLSRMVGGS